MKVMQALGQIKKQRKVRIMLSLIMIFCSSLLQTYVIQSFINPQICFQQDLPVWRSC